MLILLLKCVVKILLVNVIKRTEEKCLEKYTVTKWLTVMRHFFERVQTGFGGYTKYSTQIIHYVLESVARWPSKVEIACDTHTWQPGQSVVITLVSSNYGH